MVLHPLKLALSRIAALFAPSFNWWRPIRISPLLGINMDYGQFDMLLDSTVLTTPQDPFCDRFVSSLTATGYL